ncbi:hypothetical protein ABN448_09515 [Delftia acidovorans]|uniref:SDH family Clp fold serine proteinase n=1 Tax=Delftia acidovorans TaxID=80866 RepID=UPI0032DFCF1C
MGIEKRVELLSRLEKARGRPLITYITSSRPNASANIAADVVHELMSQLDALPKGSEELDLLLVSNGGDPTVAWRIVSLIRERVHKFAVLVPQAAYSAATLIALGADEIVMHPHGNLGPTDPQIRSARSSNGSERTPFGSEDLAAFLKFAKEVGLTDQTQLLSVFNHFCEEVGSVAVGVAARSSQLGVTMGEKLLQLHMKADGDRSKARAISEKLTRDFFHHGYPLSRMEAKAIGLPIGDHDAEVEDLLWRIWLDYSDELQLRSMANDFEFLVGNPDFAPLLSGIPHGLVQVNSASALAVMPQSGSNGIVIPPVRFERIYAYMESPRLATRHVMHGSILAGRQPDLNIKLAKVVDFTGWITIDLPQSASAVDSSSGHPGKSSRPTARPPKPKEPTK